jgi:hypothetical protein
MLGIGLNEILFIRMPINGNQLAFRLLCAIIQAHLANTAPHRCARKPETDAIETDDLYSPKYGVKNNNFYGFLDIDFDLIFPPVRARARVTGSKPRADHAVAPEGVFLSWQRASSRVCGHDSRGCLRVFPTPLRTMRLG